MIFENPPIEYEIDVATIDGHFEVAITMRNTSSQQISLSRSDGGVFHVKLRDNDGNIIWEPSMGRTQSIISWTVEPESHVVNRFTIPNKDMAEKRSEDLADEFSYLDSQPISYVNPDDVRVIWVDAIVPSLEQEQQLRQRFEQRDIQDTLPKETMDSLSNSI